MSPLAVQRQRLEWSVEYFWSKMSCARISIMCVCSVLTLVLPCGCGGVRARAPISCPTLVAQICVAGGRFTPSVPEGLEQVPAANAVGPCRVCGSLVCVRRTSFPGDESHGAVG